MLDDSGCGFENSQIGFFGGSFTAIDRERMVGLLSIAREYIDKGIAQSVRVSTRPDCIDEEILGILKEYGVTHIELGVQSTDDNVLSVCKRGHKAEDSFKAAQLILEKGFVFGGQMMIGLPQATSESEIKTALDIVKMGATETRIYPTVVFEGTELFEMAKKGEYKPLCLEEAVDRSAKCYKIFHDNGVNVLRVGLHASENLKNAPMGANHQSIGELVKGRVYTDIIIEKAGNCKNKLLSIEIKRSDISMLCGYNGSAINRISEKTGASRVEIIPADLPRFDPKITTRSV